MKKLFCIVIVAIVMALGSPIQGNSSGTRTRAIETEGKTVVAKRYKHQQRRRQVRRHKRHHQRKVRRHKRHHQRKVRRHKRHHRRNKVIIRERTVYKTKTVYKKRRPAHHHRGCFIDTVIDTARKRYEEEDTKPK